MEYTLKKFGDCDSFSLSTVWKKDFLLTKEQAEHVLKDYEDAIVEGLRQEYAAMSDDEKAKLPPFDELWNDYKERYCPIAKEIVLSGKIVLLKHEGVPQNLINFWTSCNTLGFCQGKIEMFLRDGTTPPEDTLPPEYAPIKPYLIKVVPSFFHHCASGGAFKCHFFFELNDATKEWLLQYPHPDCTPAPLEDLALYKDGYIKLSTCSHEGIYNEITTLRRSII